MLFFFVTNLAVINFSVSLHFILLDNATTFACTHFQCMSACYMTDDCVMNSLCTLYVIYIVEDYKGTMFDKQYYVFVENLYNGSVSSSVSSSVLSPKYQ